MRFWETRFSQIKPLKRAGGRRFYRPEDIELLRAIRFYLYDEGLTIKGVQKMLREQGAPALRSEGRAVVPGADDLREALKELREAERLLLGGRRGERF